MKMKNKIVKTLIATASLMTITSCSDSLLDTKPLDEYSEEIVWSDTNLAQSFVYNSCSCYVKYICQWVHPYQKIKWQHINVRLWICITPLKEYSWKWGISGLLLSLLEFSLLWPLWLLLPGHLFSLTLHCCLVLLFSWNMYIIHVCWITNVSVEKVISWAKKYGF